VPIFFPIQKSSIANPFTNELFPLTQAVSCGHWCIEHMNQIDPDIEYARVIHTDGHNWKLYEVHRSHVKKTKFFKPRPIRLQTQKHVPHTNAPRFFDDHEHMLSVIGMLRFAMGIPDSIIQASEVY